MISDKFISDAANAKIAAGGLTELELAQLSGAQPALDSTITKVNLIADLPDVAANLGRMIYVIEEEKYYYSNGEEWSIDYDTSYSSSSETYSWGSNAKGQLGDGTVTAKSSPGTIVSGGLNWSSLVGSRGILPWSVGTTTDGDAYAWGTNQGYVLGAGGGVSRSSPVIIVGGLNWSQISAGIGTFNLGVTTTGVIYGWGSGNDGRLGTGDISTQTSPVSVIGGLTFTQVAAGGYHAVAIATDGAAWAWGRNSQGALGIGTHSYGTSRTSPQSVLGGHTWSQVAAGFSTCLGITNTGVAYGWGTQSGGALGNGTTSYGVQNTPVSVVGGLTWSTVSAGNQHSLGITSTGIAYGWGAGGGGRLGNGSTASTGSPASVLGGITNWSQVSAGYTHSVGVTLNGIAYAWGANNYGGLGDGTTTSRLSPITVVGGFTGWSAISAASSHTLGIIFSETGIE